MALFASLTVATLCLLPQEPQDQNAERLRSELTKAEQQSLNRKAKAWFEAWVDEARATKQREREGAQRKERQAREAFMKEWEAKGRKGREERDLLGNVGDLLKIFEDVFPYERQSTSGEPKRISASPQDDMPGYTLMVPRGYNQDRPYRGVLLVPGYNAATGDWMSVTDHFDKTWKDSQLAGETIFMLPELEKGLELDPPPDLTKEIDRQAEEKRNWLLLRSFGQVNRDYRLDRNRLILDAGKEACGHALRMATSFPNQFAGIVLRWPVDPDELRLDNLAGVPVLVLYDAETKDAALRIHQALEKVEPGFCQVLEGKGDYPFPGSKPEVDAWAKGVERNLFRNKVVLAPNQSRFLKSYWVALTQMEPVESLPRNDRPRVTVETDRAANRIDIQARHVGGLSLLLNDALVDLDKEITVVVNGKAQTRKEGRQFKRMIDLIFAKFDPSFLFTTEMIVEVPPEPVPANANAGKEKVGETDTAGGKSENGGDGGDGDSKKPK